MAEQTVTNTVKVWIKKEGEEECDEFDIEISKDATLRYLIHCYVLKNTEIPNLSFKLTQPQHKRIFTKPYSQPHPAIPTRIIVF